MRPSFGPYDLHAMTDKTVTHDYADVLEDLVAKRYRVGHRTHPFEWDVGGLDQVH